MQSLSSLITAEQKEFFAENGYCVVSGLFSLEEVDRIEAFFEDFKRNGEKIYDSGVGDVSYVPTVSYEEVDPTKAQLRAIHPHRRSETVKQWLLNPNVAAVLEELFGRPPLAALTMYYFKPPGGKGQGMHQDNFYLMAKPATCIAAWTAIDAADVDNGCLWVVPGSHRGDILCPEKDGEKWMNYSDTHITKFPRGQKPVPVPVPRGSTMFFHGNLIHGSGPNRTKDRSRRTFISHYIDNASVQVSRYYHPILNMAGEVVSNIAEVNGGGPCGGWEGALH